ncbi:MAG: hypothetical protein E5Y65_05775 [Mesorhizobium sp.]|nr:MAG: hypothetical protein EOS14_04650 [Mesorhizobium sp.]TIL76604.1 MAG: hypothetical protein E5Y70_02270 [Mesorhizobium sp.]TIL92670.1 MAG: hypothetical protein E5Y65_05775 [Mesorhizobium sp.]TIM02095.1 MAG: hypothetical protein E5Y64_06570 [Mesorhizobium sp.]TIM36352.1 MAG: hypothetical protein E5Y61_04260 [Mesorhizobium sp.]
MNSVQVGAAPHPYPLPVKNGERGIASVAAGPLLPVTIRGEVPGRAMRGSAAFLHDVKATEGRQP